MQTGAPVHPPDRQCHAGADHVEVEDAEDYCALSTVETEYYSASEAGCKVLYLQELLLRLGFGQKNSTPVYEDNTACIESGSNVIAGLERAKHIDIRKHFAHEAIQNGHMKLIRVSTTS